MNVAFIGMGTMGSAMALNLLKAGFAVTVHNRTRQREEPVAQAGARRAGSPQSWPGKASVCWMRRYPAAPREPGREPYPS
jgi:3-hydroxyisobutyrate dehydrogenase